MSLQTHLVEIGPDQLARDEWLDLAVENARAAVILGKDKLLSKQALYMTQQSIEAATKALARNTGMSHKDIRTWGHNNLNLFLFLLEQFVASTKSSTYVDNLLALSAGLNDYNSTEKLQRVIELTISPKDSQDLARDKKKAASEFFSSMLTTTPEDLLVLLNVLVTLDGILTANHVDALKERLTNAPYFVEVPHYDETFAEAVGHQIIEQCRTRVQNLKIKKFKLEMGTVAEQVILGWLEEAIAEHGKDQFRAELEAEGGKIVFTPQNFMEILVLPKPESTEGVGRVSVLKRQEGAPLNLG